MVNVRPERVASLSNELTIPFFIRGKEYKTREQHVEMAKRRRIIRTEAMISMIIGGAMVGGAVAALLLSFFLAQGSLSLSIVAIGVGLLGYHMVRAGATEYVASLNETYQDADIE